MGINQVWLKAITPGMRSCTLQKGWDLRPEAVRPMATVPPTSPSPSPDPMASRVIKAQCWLPPQCHQRSDRSGGSRQSHHGWQWCHRESRGHMKINLPIFKDEDTKDAVTYQSWCWDLTVYCHALGAEIAPFSPTLSASLQGYPGELVRSLVTDITLDDVLTILDEHYNNVKALDALNQDLF